MKRLRLDKGQIEVVDNKVAEILRMKSGHERLRMVWDAWNFYEKTITTYLKYKHPEWAENQIREEIVRRVTYGSM
jgi:hypothetical protein